MQNAFSLSKAATYSIFRSYDIVVKQILEDVWPISVSSNILE